MYQEFYFPDVTFKQPKEIMPKTAIAASSEVLNPTMAIGRYNQVFEIYRDTMEMIINATGADLTLEKRQISFVDIETLKESAKQKKIDKKYGTYAVEGILGMTNRNIDGSFEILIGVSGDSNANDFENILLVIAHEYGHTIGPVIPDLILEELKAYAFQKLFAKYLNPKNNTQLDDRFSDNIHNLAGSMFNQLEERGFRPEAIISTLTWLPFGAYRPDSNIRVPKPNKF